MTLHKPQSKLPRRAATLFVMAALATAGAAARPSGTLPVRLLGVSAQGNAVLIEASEPVAYAVRQPDPLTVVVELRGVSVADANNQVQRRDPVEGVTLEQVSAVDGKALARVRVALARPADYAVRSARGTIRLELKPAARTAAMVLPLPLPAAETLSAGQVAAPETVRLTPPATPAVGSEPDNAPEPDITIEQALANVASIIPAENPPVDPIVALAMSARPPLRTTASSSNLVAPATRPASPPTPAAAAPAPRVRQAAAPVQAPPQPTTISQVSGGERRYTGHPISLDFQGADLRAVLREFAQISGLNIIIDAAVQAIPVDIQLKDIPWDQAFETLLRTNQLGYEAEGTIIRIAPLRTLEDEQKQRTTLSAAKALAGELQVRTFALSYAKAAEMQPLLVKSALSSRGEIQVDTRTNTLIITDLPDRLQTANNLIGALDRPEPQVEVEARVVQTTRDFAKAIGVQWGLNGRVNSGIGNTLPLAFPNNGSLGGRTGGNNLPNDISRGTGLDNTATAVNLGVPGATTALGLALGAVNGAFNLDVALSALERSGKGRVLSTPRLTTQNNIEAEVAQGVQIPIQTVANNTVTVTFRDAVLKLIVTPQITSANTVIMKITIENATPDFSRQVNGIPPIDTQRANTQVQVNDGATTVIGGIFVSREQTSNERVPVMHRIPLLGWLFKKDSTADESRELLIFITPRILRG